MIYYNNNNIITGMIFHMMMGTINKLYITTSNIMKGMINNDVIIIL